MFSIIPWETPVSPAPKKVNASIHKIVDETDSIHLHGYSMAPGFEEPQAAIAADLSRALVWISAASSCF